MTGRSTMKRSTGEEEVCRGCAGAAPAVQFYAPGNTPPDQILRDVSQWILESVIPALERAHGKPACSRHRKMLRQLRSRAATGIRAIDIRAVDSRAKRLAEHRP